MEDLKDILYDDAQQKHIEIQNRKKKRKKRWRRMKRMMLVGFLLAGTGYFLSDLSKVKSLSVSGNTYYRDQDIFHLADLSYETRYVIMPKLLITWNLEKQDLIDTVDVSKTWLGRIHIDVKEKTILGSRTEADGKSYVIVAGSPYEKIEVEDQYEESLIQYPLIGDFDEENMQKLADAFRVKKREVSAEIISMISEIQPYSRSYDEHMVKLVMQDGNTLYSSYDAIPLLNDYKQVLRSSNKSHVCMELDESNASIYESPCDK